MNLKQLQYFTKLAETEHYRKAAEACILRNRALTEPFGKWKKSWESSSLKNGDEIFI